MFTYVIVLVDGKNATYETLCAVIITADTAQLTTVYTYLLHGAESFLRI